MTCNASPKRLLLIWRRPYHHSLRECLAHWTQLPDAAAFPDSASILNAALIFSQWTTTFAEVEESISKL
jgi:hypothetical protein